MDRETYLRQISARIREIREEKGVSIYAMAKKMNTSRTQINRIESGQNTGIGTLRDVCLVLDIKMSEILDAED